MANRDDRGLDSIAIGSDVAFAQLNLTSPDQAALDKARTVRSTAFNFKMVGIEPGATLTFSKDQTSSCTVVGLKKVEFEGEETRALSS